MHHVPERVARARSSTSSAAKFVDSVDGATFDVLDPVSNQTYVTAAAGQAEDIDRAVAAATRRVPERPVAADEGPRRAPAS